MIKPAPRPSRTHSAASVLVAVASFIALTAAAIYLVGFVLKLTNYPFVIREISYSSFTSQVKMDVICEDGSTKSVKYYYGSWRNGPMNPICNPNYAEIACQNELPFHANKAYIKGESQIKERLMRKWKTPDRTTLPDRVKILFTIMMTTSDDDVGLLRHVLSVIYSPDHYYVIHADYGNSFPDTIWNRPYNKFVEDMKKYPNIVIVPYEETIKGSWAAVSLVWMELLAVRIGYDRWGDWDYVINMAPTTLPTKPLSQLEAFLFKNRGKSWMKIDAIIEEFDSWPEYLRSCQVQCDSTLYMFDNSTCIPNPVEYQYWSEFSTLQAHQWKVLNYDVLRHIFYDTGARNQFQRSWEFFRTAQITDERWLIALFHSLNMQETFKIENNPLVQVIFGPNGRPLLTPDHITNITRSDRIFFTRKVENYYTQKKYFGLLGLPYKSMT